MVKPLLRKMLRSDFRNKKGPFCCGVVEAQYLSVRRIIISDYSIGRQASAVFYFVPPLLLPHFLKRFDEWFENCMMSDANRPLILLLI